LADIFTKALPADHFNYLVRRLGMRSLSPKEHERLAKSHQSRRDLPGTLPLDRVEVLGSDDVVTTSFQRSQNSRPPMLDHQDKNMMKAQVHVSKSSAISSVQALPLRKHYCQIYQVVKHMLRRRLLASFQDREHDGGDTRWQDGIKDNDVKI
nr:ribonuclease H-like domain-containing protein [Tanacetum cinerariifolium]